MPRCWHHFKESEVNIDSQALVIQLACFLAWVVQWVWQSGAAWGHFLAAYFSDWIQGSTQAVIWRTHAVWCPSSKSMIISDLFCSVIWSVLLHCLVCLTLDNSVPRISREFLDLNANWVKAKIIVSSCKSEVLIPRAFCFVGLLWLWA